jgi:hypothetical protein
MDRRHVGGGGKREEGRGKGLEERESREDFVILIFSVMFVSFRIFSVPRGGCKRIRNFLRIGRRF